MFRCILKVLSNWCKLTAEKKTDDTGIYLTSVSLRTINLVVYQRSCFNNITKLTHHLETNHFEMYREINAFGLKNKQADWMI